MQGQNDIHISNAASVMIRIEGTKFEHVITIDRWINLVIRIYYITIFPKVRLFFVYISTGYKTPENMEKSFNKCQKIGLYYAFHAANAPPLT